MSNVTQALCNTGRLEALSNQRTAFTFGPQVPLQTQITDSAPTDMALIGPSIAHIYVSWPAKAKGVQIL